MSKFDSITQAAQAMKRGKDADVQKSEMPEVQTSESAEVPNTPAAVPAAASVLPEAKAIGRPKSGGKKSRSDYRQVTIYLPDDLYQQGRDEVRRLERGPKDDRKDFSEIVADALRAYFQTSGSPKG